MEVWLNDWKCFNADEMVAVPQLDTPVKGLALVMISFTALMRRGICKCMEIIEKSTIHNIILFQYEI